MDDDLFQKSCLLSEKMVIHSQDSFWTSVRKPNFTTFWGRFANFENFSWRKIGRFLQWTLAGRSRSLDWSSDPPSLTPEILGPVVQSWSCAKPGLKFDPLFNCVCCHPAFLLKLEKREVQLVKPKLMKKYFQVTNGSFPLNFEIT